MATRLRRHLRHLFKLALEVLLPQRDLAVTCWAEACQQASDKKGKEGVGKEVTHLKRRRARSLLRSNSRATPHPQICLPLVMPAAAADQHHQHHRHSSSVRARSGSTRSGGRTASRSGRSCPGRPRRGRPCQRRPREPTRRRGPSPSGPTGRARRDREPIPLFARCELGKDVAQAAPSQQGWEDTSMQRNNRSTRASEDSLVGPDLDQAVAAAGREPLDELQPFLRVRRARLRVGQGADADCGCPRDRSDAEGVRREEGRFPRAVVVEGQDRDFAVRAGAGEDRTELVRCPCDGVDWVVCVGGDQRSRSGQTCRPPTRAGGS